LIFETRLQAAERHARVACPFFACSLIISDPKVNIAPLKLPPPETRDTQHKTRNLKHGTQKHTKPETRTRNPKPETRGRRSGTRAETRRWRFACLARFLFLWPTHFRMKIYVAYRFSTQFPMKIYCHYCVLFTQAAEWQVWRVWRASRTAVENSSLAWPNGAVYPAWPSG